MSDFSVDFTKSYARRRPEEFGAQGVDPVGAWVRQGLMAIFLGCWLIMRFYPVNHT